LYVQSLCIGRVQSNPTSLLRSAYEEYKELNKKYGISWYKSIVYLAEKLKIDLEKIKNFSRDKLKFNLKDCLKKNFTSFWREERTSSLGLNEGKLTTFYKIKETFSREFYLDSLCFKQRSILTKFRLSAHSLRLETGRYEKCRDEGGNVKKKLDREQRKCLFCNLDKVEDE
jgi:CRISPR/Cas system CSM-associated protein Csm2 small subunit